MPLAKKPKEVIFRKTKALPSLTTSPPRAATTITFEDFIAGQEFSFPFVMNGITFHSPYDPSPTKIIDNTIWGEPLMQDAWLTTGIALRPDGVIINLPHSTDLCSVTFVPDLPETARAQARIEWFDSAGMLIDAKDIAGIPLYRPFTHVISDKDVLTVIVYSNVETPLCRIQAVLP